MTTHEDRVAVMEALFAAPQGYIPGAAFGYPDRKTLAFEAPDKSDYFEITVDVTDMNVRQILDCALDFIEA